VHDEDRRQRGAEESIKHAASCNYKKLRNGPATTCKTTAPPACAGSLVADAIALAWGANNPVAAAVDRRAVGAQINCQKQISARRAQQGCARSRSRARPRRC
jgi:hypothetical protein